jgi:hypothetical protein
MTGFSAHLMFSRGRPRSMQQCLFDWLIAAVRGEKLTSTC